MNSLGRSLQLIALLPTMAHAMCYLVEDGNGIPVYVSERPPVNMAADSPSAEVQAKWPNGHMLILNECPLTANEQYARRLQVITETKQATALRLAQADAPVQVKPFDWADFGGKPQQQFPAGLTYTDYGWGNYQGYGYSYYGYPQSGYGNRSHGYRRHR